jgi:hypothetical protein
VGFQGLGPTLPYHVTFFINPYRLKSKDAVYAVIYEKKPYNINDYSASIGDQIKSPITSLFSSIINFILGIPFYLLDFITNIPVVGRVAIGESAKQTLKEIVPKGPSENFPQNHFNGANDDEEFISPKPAVIRGLGFEVGVPFDNLQETMDIILAQLGQSSIPCTMHIRYVKKSGATLAFTHFDRTAIFDVGCLYGTSFFTNTRGLFDNIFKSMESSSIPHTYHWGKTHPVNDRWVANAFGSDKQLWMDQRALLLDTEDKRNMFSNDLTDALGLT